MQFLLVEKFMLQFFSNRFAITLRDLLHAVYRRSPTSRDGLNASLLGIMLQPVLIHLARCLQCMASVHVRTHGSARNSAVYPHHQNNAYPIMQNRDPYF